MPLTKRPRREQIQRLNTPDGNPPGGLIIAGETTVYVDGPGGSGFRLVALNRSQVAAKRMRQLCAANGRVSVRASLNRFYLSKDGKACPACSDGRHSEPGVA